MLTKKQISDIRDHLEKAQNPLFLFDNDQDGLCSFLILRKYLGRGKGFPIKGNALSEDYLRKVKEFDSDYIFVLDKPRISKEFFDEVEKINLPLVWIDHHESDINEIPDFVNYYNPLYNRKKTNEPVTYLCYQISGKKEDLWLGVVGCIADSFVPDFYEVFKKKNPELCFDIENEEIKAFDLFYKSEIGKIARILGFGIKDKTTNVIRMMRFLVKAKGPYDVLQENKENKLVHKRFLEIEKKYSALINKAKIKTNKEEGLIFFEYSGDISMSAEIANGLKYEFPDKTIVVLYVKGLRINVSVRGFKVRSRIMEIVNSLEDATGGGHENAVGAQISKADLDKFKELCFERFN